MTDEAFSEGPFQRAAAALRSGELGRAAEELETAIAHLRTTVEGGHTLVVQAAAYIERSKGIESLHDIARDFPDDVSLFEYLGEDGRAKEILDEVDEICQRITSGPKDVLDVDATIDQLEVAWRDLEWLHHRYFDIVGVFLTSVANRWGEAKIEPMWRWMLRDALDALDQASAMDAATLSTWTAQLFEAHFGGPTRLEEDDLTVRVSHDPCGTGGRLRRFGAFDGRMPVGSTKETHAWSWRERGVSYYCVHCCILWEQEGIRRSGYPIRIHGNVADPAQPIEHTIYKDPANIPRSVFERVGATQEDGELSGN